MIGLGRSSLLGTPGVNCAGKGVRTLPDHRLALSNERKGLLPLGVILGGFSCCLIGLVDRWSPPNEGWLRGGKLGTVSRDPVHPATLSG